MRLVALGRHVGERRGEQRAADAVADHVHLVLAGGLCHRVERRERALDHVVVKGLAGVLASGLTQEITNTV